jgi:hypothetical protein
VAINASIITDTAKDITKRTVVDYGAGVFAHTTKDWSQHNCISVRFRSPFISPGGETVSTQGLRLLATLDDGSAQGNDIALLVPLDPVGTSAITNSPPIIVQQPANKVAPPFSTVQLQVAVISDITVTFQWYKKNSSNVFEALTGKTATTLVIPNSTEADSGDYRVIATNENGSVTSDTANLLVSAGASGSEGDGWYESLPGVRLFRRIFG